MAVYRPRKVPMVVENVGAGGAGGSQKPKLMCISRRKCRNKCYSRRSMTRSTSIPRLMNLAPKQNWERYKPTFCISFIRYLQTLGTRLILFKLEIHLGRVLCTNNSSNSIFSTHCEHYFLSKKFYHYLLTIKK